MPNTYEVRLVQRNTNTLIAPLVDAVVEEVTWSLRGFHTFSFWLPWDSPHVKRPLMLENEVQLWVNGDLAKGIWGPIIDVDNDHAGSTFVVQDLKVYLLGRVLRDDLTYTDVEQRTIMWNLVNYAQTGTNRPLAFTQETQNPAGTTQLRERHYLKDESQDLFALVNAFPDLQNGVDWDIVIDGTGLRQFKTWYPNRGTFRSTMRLEFGKNISRFKHKEIGGPGRQATKVYMGGPSAQDANGVSTKMWGTYEDAAASLKYGQWEKAMSDGNQDSTQEWLDSRAQAETTARKDPSQPVELEAVEVAGQYLGVVELGDTLPLLIKHGRTDIDRNVRIVQINWKVRPDLIGLGVN